MKMIKLGVFLGLIVLLSSMSLWGSSACNLPTVIPPAGSLDFDFLAPSGTNFYEFALTAGHSYSIAVHQDYDDLNNDTPAANVKLFIDAGTCGSQITVPGATPQTAVTTTVDPALPGNGYRFSIIPATSGTYELSTLNANASTGRYIKITVVETTMYSPGFFTGTGYVTSYSLANTTSAPINGTLTLLDTSGAVAGTSTITMPAKGAALVNTNGTNATNATVMNAVVNKTGGAIFAHTGPPNAVQGAAFLQNFGSNPPFTQPFELKPLRQGN